MTKVALISMWTALQYRRGSKTGVLWRCFRNQTGNPGLDRLQRGPAPRLGRVHRRARLRCAPALISNTQLRTPRSPLINVPDKAQHWIALLGRGSGAPTDGVEDYCVRLQEALKKKGTLLEVVRVPLAERG